MRQSSKSGKFPALDFYNAILTLNCWLVWRLENKFRFLGQFNSLIYLEETEKNSSESCMFFRLEECYSASNIQRFCTIMPFIVWNVIHNMQNDNWLHAVRPLFNILNNTLSRNLCMKIFRSVLIIQHIPLTIYLRKQKSTSKLRTTVSQSNSLQFLQTVRIFSWEILRFNNNHDDRADVFQQCPLWLKNVFFLIDDRDFLWNFVNFTRFYQFSREPSV